MEVGGTVAASRLSWLEGQQARVARGVLTLGDCHIAVLNDRPAILVKHMLLPKLAKCGSPWKHHIRRLIERSCATISVHDTALLLRTWCTLAMSVSIFWTAVMIVVENDGARILNHHLIAAKLLATRGHPRAKLMDKATSFTLAVADSSILSRLTVELRALFPISISLSHVCQTVIKCLL